MNLRLASPRTEEDNGYFRIGNVVLSIPPEGISTNKIIANEEYRPLRSKNPMFVKTGHSRLDATVTWKALVNPEANDWSDWEKLQRIIAMFKAAPFQEVENKYLRTTVMDELSYNKDVFRMAFALRQLQIETLPDIVNGLQVTLTMSLFNYAPYSTDFAYLGEGNTRVSADASEALREFLDNWVNANLGQAWKATTPGDMRVSWREYQMLPLGSYPTEEKNRQDQAKPPQPTAPQAPESKPTELPKPQDISTQAPANTLSPADDIRQKITKAAAEAGVSVPLALAIAEEESNFTQFASKKMAKGTVAGQPYKAGDVLRASDQAIFNVLKDKKKNGAYVYEHDQNGVLTAAGKEAAMKAAIAFPLSQRATGIFQILPSTAAGLGFTQEQVETVDGNIAAGIQLLSSLSTQRKGVVEEILIAYSEGPSYFRTGKLMYPTQTLAMIEKVKASMKQYGASNVVSASVPTTAVVVNTGSAKQASAAEKSTESTRAKMAKEVQLNGYLLDYATEKGLFAFAERDLDIIEPSEFSFGIPGLYANKISVMMVNHLAQLPLSSYQYPTYQHVGPPIVMVNVGLTSVGSMDSDDSEVTHTQLHRLVSAISSLENQFIRLRPEWRSVASIHRMQALFIENQVLSLCGIRAILPSDLSTRTVPDSPDLVEAELTGCQYENIFEQLEPFQVKSIQDQLAKLNSGVLSDDKEIGVLAKDRPQKYTKLAQLAKYRQNRDTQPLYMAMKDGEFYRNFDVPMPIELTEEEERQIKEIIRLEKPGQKDEVLKNLATSDDIEFLEHAAKKGRTPYSDYLRLKGMFGRYMGDLAKSIDGRIWEAVKNNEAFDPIEKFYDQLFAYELRKPNGDIAREVSSYTMDPEFKSKLDQISQEYAKQTPAVYNNRSAYADLGIPLGTDRGTYSPTYYLYDYQRDLKLDIADRSQDLAMAAEKVHSDFNQVISESRVQTLQVSAKYLTSNIVIPSLTMARAFPTFKLFLIEEDNNGPFYCYDDFYSYASVLSMEIIRSKDKPDLAVLQISNLANLLGHKLYDNTVAGRREDERDNSGTTLPNTSTGEAVTAGPGVIGKERVQEDIYGYNRVVSSVRDLSKYAKTTTGAERSLPLQYYALQPGSKIQIRMGFSNNPDELFPVFHGLVVEVQGDEMLTIVAQGFQVELMTPYMALNQNFGGLSRGWLNSGDAVAVMKSAIRAETAKHFGRWQVEPNGQHFIRDWKWSAAETLAKAAESAGVDAGGVLADMISRVYDRSYENISITRKQDIAAPTTTDVLESQETTEKRTIFDSSGAWTKFAIEEDTEVKATWTKVFDGDTIEVKLPDGRITHIRLDYIDAPELGMPGADGRSAEISKRKLEEYLSRAPNREITIQARKNELYGRALGTITIGTFDVNAEMVRWGYAETFSESAGGPNPYEELQRIARARGLGIWGRGYEAGSAGRFRQQKRKANKDSSYELKVKHRQEFKQTSSNLTPRPLDYENTWGGWLTPKYHAPRDTDKCSPWNIIRDVSRRFPEQAVAVKNYGFPFQCEATLVFSRPEGFYYARRPLPREIEINDSKLAGTIAFLPWWNSQGRDMAMRVLEMLNEAEWFDSSIRNIRAINGVKSFEELVALMEEVKTATENRTLLPTRPKIKDLLEKTALAADRVVETYRQHARYMEATTDKNGLAKLNFSPCERVQMIRRFVVIGKENIIKNDIRVNDQIFNAVSFKDDILKASDAIPNHHIRLLSLDDVILNDDNMKDPPELKWAIMQSFLKEEVAKMYEGYLTVTGIPELCPGDVILLHDPVTTMSGPLEVEEVVHTFDQENGFITVIKPRAFVHVNEFVSASLTCAVWSMVTNNLGDLFTAELVGATAGAGILFASGTAAVFLGAGAMISPVGLFVVGAATLAGSTIGAHLATKQMRRNPLFLTPLTRYERAWVGGLQGWAVTSMSSLFWRRVDELYDDEIQPLLDSYYTAKSILKR